MRHVLLLAALAGALAACDPFGLPATRAVEGGAAATLSPNSSFELQGTYTAAGSRWTVDMKLARPDKAHIVATNGADTVEAIVIGDVGYFRGHDFLVRHVTDPRSQFLVAAAGNSWWKGLAVVLPRLPDLTDGAAFRATFLGPAVDRRTDHRPVGGVDAVELSGARGDVYIASAPPYQLLRLVVRKGVSIDGVTDADIAYKNAGADFAIAPPAPVLDFGNASTLPPIYTVVTVDASACGSPCTVSASVRNIGGLEPATAPSYVAFTMTDPVTKKTLGGCTATIQPDVPYNQTTSVSCTIAAAPVNAAVVTAVATNPGRA